MAGKVRERELAREYALRIAALFVGHLEGGAYIRLELDRTTHHTAQGWIGGFEVPPAFTTSALGAVRRCPEDELINLRRLVRHVRQTVFLIVDEHPVHVAGVVKRWVARHRQRLRLFFLPGYSPDLNPDEFLNQDVKTNAVGRKRPRDKGELISNVRRYLWSTQRRPKKVRRYFRHPSVRYAA